MTATVSAYDGMAAAFERRRKLPDGVARSIRGAIVAETFPVERPLVLDLGAGTGRIGWPFVASGDAYIGLDLSFGMLHRFAERGGPVPHLIQGDGAALPFADASFDAVILVQVLSGSHGWRRIAAEARRVLRSSGVLVTGQTVAPADGIDARMKQQAARIVEDLGASPYSPYQSKSGDQARDWLRQSATVTRTLTVGTGIDQRTPGRFIERHGTGARFASLDEPVRQAALHRLATWGVTTFGSLGAVFDETFNFQLQFFRFNQGATT
jgi:ubiquinone/menaquinone biosynthesis C-methylase UbiE